jgi:hypothetical protein
VATVIVRTPGSPAGADSENPPSRASTAVARAAIVVRSSRSPVLAASEAGDVADAPAGAVPACRTRPATVQDAGGAAGATVPAAQSSVSRQASP